jgi:hypothetical protein
MSLIVQTIKRDPWVKKKKKNYYYSSMNSVEN